MIKLIDILKEIKITPNFPQIEMKLFGTGITAAWTYNPNEDHIIFVLPEFSKKEHYISESLTREEAGEVIEILNKKNIKYILDESDIGNGPKQEYKYKILIPKQNVRII